MGTDPGNDRRDSHRQQPSGCASPAPLFHLALRPEWEEVVRAGGPYRRSTLGRSLDEEGFVHCAEADQVAGVAERYYRGRDDVVLLVLDPRRLEAEVRVEPVGPGGEHYPHVYGPIPLAAVVAVEELVRDAAGRVVTPEGRP